MKTPLATTNIRSW